MPRPLDARVVGRAEARVVAELDDLGARPPARAPGRRRTSRCRRRSAAAAAGSRPSEASSAGSGPAESCRTTTMENGRHAASASTARRAPRGLGPAERGDLAWPAASRRARSAGSRVDARAARRRAPSASPGGTYSAPSPEHLAEHREVADDRGRAGREALDRREPEALEPRRQHDRERAGVERAEVVDPPEPPHPAARAGRAGRPRRPRARPRARAPGRGGSASTRTSGALRGSSAPTKRNVGARARPPAAQPPRGQRHGVRRGRRPGPTRGSGRRAPPRCRSAPARRGGRGAAGGRRRARARS